ncbi:UNVERIFIED_CONTAM: hypothetical protein NCL1_41310 [Trichonephila clavipes]
MNDGETSSRRQGVGRLHAIKEKGHRTLCRMVKQNRSQTVAQLTAKYNAGPMIAGQVSQSIYLLQCIIGTRSFAAEF